jgi:hypothetical protein
LRSVIGIFKVEFFEAFREVAAKFQNLPLVGGRIKAGLADLSASFGEKAKQNAQALQESVSKSASGLKEGISEAISASLSKIKEISTAMFTPDPKAKEQLAAMLEELQAKVRATQEQARKENPAAAGKVGGISAVSAESSSQRRAFSLEAITSSLGRIGGGVNRGANITVMPMVDQQKITNNYLQEQNKTLVAMRSDLSKPQTAASSVARFV